MTPSQVKQWNRINNIIEKNNKLVREYTANNEQAATTWKFYPSAHACPYCKELGKHTFVYEPERAHPNCTCRLAVTQHSSQDKKKLKLEASPKKPVENKVHSEIQKLKKQKKRAKRLLHIKNDEMKKVSEEIDTLEAEPNSEIIYANTIKNLEYQFYGMFKHEGYIPYKQDSFSPVRYYRIGKRPLSDLEGIYNLIAIAEHHLLVDNLGNNVGLSVEGKVVDSPNLLARVVCSPEKYRANIIDEAFLLVDAKWEKISMLMRDILTPDSEVLLITNTFPLRYHLIVNNCQKFVSDVIDEAEKISKARNIPLLVTDKEITPSSENILEFSKYTSAINWRKLVKKL